MVNRLFCLSVFLLATVITGCQPRSFDTKEELLAHLKDPENGYHHTKTVNGVNYTLTYRPTDLLVSQEVGDDPDPMAVAKARKKYGDQLYFNLSMSAQGQELLNHRAGNRAQFGAMVNQLAFGMHNSLHLTNQKRDTMALLDYVYPRMYGMSNSTSMMLVYKKDQTIKDSEKLRLTIADLGFGTGEVGFTIDGQTLKNDPKLRF